MARSRSKLNQISSQRVFRIKKSATPTPSNQLKAVVGPILTPAGLIAKSTGTRLQ